MRLLTRILVPLGVTFLLVRDALESARRATKVGLEGTERIARIVRSLRLLSKPGGDGREADVDGVLDATLTLAGRRLRDRARLETALPEGLRVAIAPDELGQVLLNLLLNAADAVPAESGRVRIAAHREGDCVEIRVQNNGPGVEPGIRERLFSPFLTTKANGTGLGLSISRSLAERAGGTLFLADDGRPGATFVLRIPASGAPGPHAPGEGTAAPR